MNESCLILDGYKKLFGISEAKISVLPQSGSDRKYFRITDSKKSIIGVFNNNTEENAAFVGFTNHFISKGLPVPEILGYFPDQNIYFLHDLGDTNLYIWLLNRQYDRGFDSKAEDLFRKVIDKLILFQTEGIKGLDMDLCYPHKSFDRQSMMWDMNYFKYMFLKLLAVPFSESRLEHDFSMLVDFLLEEKQFYFMYRDFQSANIMIVCDEPWFIDYQGGRLGAPQYDIASLLYDAKAGIPKQSRERLFDYYLDRFYTFSGADTEKFRVYYKGFTLIRLMQALGAFGFRGLYEKKPTFIESIVPAVRLLTELVDDYSFPVMLPELFKAILTLKTNKIYKELES